MITISRPMGGLDRSQSDSSFDRFTPWWPGCGGEVSTGRRIGEPVAAGSGLRTGSSAHGASECERFARLIDESRAAILACYQAALETSRSPDFPDPCCRQRLAEIGSQILTEVAASVRDDRKQIDDGYRLSAYHIGELSARQLCPAEWHKAATLFFDVTVGALANHARGHSELFGSFVTALQTLNQSLAVRVELATVDYTSYLLNRIHEANVDERRRIARELHDRLGEGLSVALRQLDLCEIGTQTAITDPGRQTKLARDALVEAMRRLRVVTSDLRQEQVTGLEKALTQYLDSVAAAAQVSLRVSGDESWASYAVLDEVFLIIREGLRNALQHASPRHVLIAVNVAPQELTARVQDDGRGFVVPDPADAARAASAGLASMRERAALLGGRLLVTSAPGHGSCVELFVPLLGRRDEQPG
jgi:signal transduction histidine kinase